MGRILVTGGTGVLGQALVRRLGGAEVRILTRRRAAAAADGGPVSVRGDLHTGEGLEAAASGADVIVHCASVGGFRHPERDVQATRRLLAAVTGRPHIVYISIVGVDAIPLRYYRAKLASEQVVEASGLPCTLLRSTQFHQLVGSVLASLAKTPMVAVYPYGISVQPVDVAEVADRLAGLALGEPAGRVPDLGGPRIDKLGDLLLGYLRAVGRARPVLPLPLPGRVARAFRSGYHLTPAHRDGRRTFADFLADAVRPDGSISLPYELSRRRDAPPTGERGAEAPR